MLYRPRVCWALELTLEGKLWLGRRLVNYKLLIYKVFVLCDFNMFKG